MMVLLLGGGLLYLLVALGMAFGSLWSNRFLFPDDDPRGPAWHRYPYGPLMAGAIWPVIVLYALWLVMRVGIQTLNAGIDDVVFPKPPTVWKE